ncbi:hypothetical protein vBValSR12Z_108 [Vibrio phage vB_ValS_R12Z]
MSIYTIGNIAIYNIIIIYDFAARLCRGEKIAGGMLAGEDTPGKEGNRGNDTI